LAAVISTRSHAHDFWIEPATFRPATGGEVSIALRVGEHFKGEPVKRKNEKIKVFSIFGPGSSESRDVAGADDSDPAGVVRIDRPGLYVIGYHNHPSRIELEPAEFEAYLKEDGLDAIIAERTRRGESDKSAREIYSRCAKTIVAADGAGADGYDRSFGFPLELTPQQNPYSLRPGSELAVRLTYRDKPLAGAKVFAVSRDAPDAAMSAESDAEGRTTFRLKQPGVWLIKCVHMFRAPADADADWESLWASLTFELPGGGQDAESKTGVTP
jgi:uncharacterized GH25 family protein